MWRITFFLLAIGVISFGCSRSNERQSEPSVARGEAAAEATTPPTPAEEPWCTLPHAEWPQIVLTNLGEFSQGRSLRGASSFLIRAADGRILAATAKHLIGEAGGVTPPIPTVQLDENLNLWRMYPRTVPERFVEAVRVAPANLDEPDSDWLLLDVSPQEEYPAHPLQIRKEPVTVGEKVFLVGCPYSESNCKQNVYEGVVTERQQNMFRYDLSPPVDLRGFSGAPIVDAKGLVVGVMTVWFHANIEEEKYLEGGGEGTGSVAPDLLTLAESVE